MAVVIQHQPLSIPEICNFTDLTSFYLRPVHFYFGPFALWHLLDDMVTFIKRTFEDFFQTFWSFVVLSWHSVSSLRWTNSTNSEAFMFLWWVLLSFGQQVYRCDKSLQITDLQSAVFPNCVAEVLGFWMLRRDPCLTSTRLSLNLGLICNCLYIFGSY